MLSGIFMARKNNKNASVSFGSFMRRRLERLLPMTTLALCVCAVLSILYRYLYGTWFIDRPVTPFALLTQAFLVYSGGPISDEALGINSPMWYLCVLMICYLWYWLALWGAKKLDVTPRYFFIAMIVIGVSVSTYGINLPFLNGFSQRGYVSFFTGIILVDLYKAFKIEENAHRAAVIFGSVLAALVLWDIYSGRPLLNNQLTLDFLVYPCIIGLLVTSSVCNRIFHHKCCSVLGAVAFEVYIWHHAFIILANILKMGDYVQIPYGDGTGVVLAFLVSGFGYFVYRYVEEPINRKIKQRNADKETK